MVLPMVKQAKLKLHALVSHTPHHVQVLMSRIVTMANYQYVNEAPVPPHTNRDSTAPAQQVSFDQSDEELVEYLIDNFGRSSVTPALYSEQPRARDFVAASVPRPDSPTISISSPGRGRDTPPPLVPLLESRDFLDPPHQSLYVTHQTAESLPYLLPFFSDVPEDHI